MKVAASCFWLLSKSHRACWVNSFIRFVGSENAAKAEDQDGPLCRSDKYRESQKVSRGHVASTLEYGIPILLSELKSFNDNNLPQDSASLKQRKQK